MFDIGWSELVVIGVVALIAIGPKELPGVLRMVGQWMGKARKMADEFRGQFNEAMREAEMADLKKSFDEVKDAASGLGTSNIMTSLAKDVADATRFDVAPVTVPTTPEPPTAATFAEAEAHIDAQVESQVPVPPVEALPLAVTQDIAAPLDLTAERAQAETQAARQPEPPVPHAALPDAKAS